jgi:hypothetical protein
MRPDQTDPGNGKTIRSDGRRGEMPEDTLTDPRARALRDRDQAGLPVDDAAATARPDGATAASWQVIKSRFVDDPAGALAAAERLVQVAVDARVSALQDEAAALCARGGDDDSTEAQRTRLIRYQEYCQRMSAAALH